MNSFTTDDDSKLVCIAARISEFSGQIGIEKSFTFSQAESKKKTFGIGNFENEQRHLRKG